MTMIYDQIPFVKLYSPDTSWWSLS